MRGRMKNDARNGSEISFGSYGLQALDRGYLTNRQIESARRVLTRSLKMGGKIWIPVFPDKPITKRPAEVRMGKGKGAVDSWVMPVRQGRVLYEVEGVQESVALEALRLAGYKLPMKTRVIKRGIVL